MQPVTLLDLDGCIVNSSEPILRSLGQALVEVGLEPVTVDDLGQIIGPPLAETVPLLLARRGAAHVEAPDVISRYRALYRRASLELALLYPGMRAAIDRLAALGPIGVVTSKPRAYAEPILSTLALLDRFRVVEAPADESEPKAVTLGRALDHLGSDRRGSVVMVGDRRHDIEAGQAHGVATIGVTWGFGSGEELDGAGADALVHQPAELPAAVRRIAAGNAEEGP